MNVFRKITLQALRKNRTRTVVTVIGILLSAAMFTGVIVSVSSLVKYMRECAIYTSGNWHGSFPDVPAGKMEQLETETAVDSASLAQNIGYAKLDTLSETKPYLFLLGIDPVFRQRMPIHLTCGQMPEKSDELLLPEHLRYQGGVEYALGDTLTLDLGDRILDGTRLGPNVPYVPEGEALRIRETRRYTVVGFYERPDFEDFESPGYTALTLWDGSRPAQSIAAYFLMKNASDTYDFLQAGESVYGSGVPNLSLLRYEGVSKYDTFYVVLYGLTAILFLLILFGSVFLIYNAFSISVSERIRQFGLLASIGATKRQIRRMVFIEAGYVSLMGIPLGILSGIAGIGVTFRMIRDQFYAFYGVKEVTLRVSVSPISLLIAALAAYITVLISAWIPSRRAVRVSPMEAIRRSGEDRTLPRQVKTSPLSYRLFGLEGMLASKQFKRNRRRYRATVLSLFASVVLFISASSYCSYLTKMVTGIYEDCDYDIIYDWSGLSQEREDPLTLANGAEILGNTPGVTAYSFARVMSTEAELTRDIMPEETADKLLDPEASAKTVDTILYGMDTETFDRYLAKQGLDSARYHDPDHPLGIVKARCQSFNTETQRFEQMLLLSPETEALTIGVVDAEKWNAFCNSPEAKVATEREWSAKWQECSQAYLLEIGAFAEELPFGLNERSSYNIRVVYPMDVFFSVIPDSDFRGADQIYLKTADPVKGMAALEKTAEENGLSKDLFYNLYALHESDRNAVTIVRVFAYGFIILISLISVANVFNTISTSILLRRREYAMLKSVGMTENSVSRMMMLECVLYGVKSLIYGIPVSFLITYVIFRNVRAGYEMAFYLPWGAVGIAVCSVFIVVFSTMLYAQNKVRQDSLVETLKNENY